MFHAIYVRRGDQNEMQGCYIK